MKLSKSKRQQLRKLASESQLEFTGIEIPLADLIDLIESLEEDRDELKSKLKTDKLMSAALDNLNASIVSLTTAVNNATVVMATPPPVVTGVPEADVQSAADAVNAQATRLATATPAPPAGP